MVNVVASHSIWGQLHIPYLETCGRVSCAFKSGLLLFSRDLGSLGQLVTTWLFFSVQVDNMFESVCVILYNIPMFIMYKEFPFLSIDAFKNF